MRFSEDYGPTSEIMQGNLRKLFETVLKIRDTPRFLMYK
jgi:hypothetical protein